MLPLLYLHGLSTGDFVAALEGSLVGGGLSAAVITRLTVQWQADYQVFAAGTCRIGTTCPAGLTGSTSGCAGARSWSRLVLASARRPSHGRSCCGIAPPGPARPDGDGRRRRAGAVGSPARRLPATRAQRDGSQGRQRAWLPAHEGAGQRPYGAGRDPGCARTAATPEQHRRLRSRLRHERARGKGPRRSPRSPTTPRSCSPSSTSRLSMWLVGTLPCCPSRPAGGGVRTAPQP